MDKPIIYNIESESEIGNLKVKTKASMVRESLLHSIVSDTYTFGILLFSFWVNQTFIHSKMVSCILLFSFLFTAAFITKRQKLTKEEFKEKMEEFLKEQQWKLK